MRRVLAGAFFLATGILLTGAMTAWACTNLSQLNLGNAQGQAGQSVPLTGSSFAAAGSGDPVKIRLDSENGKVLAKAKPTETGTIETDVAIPANTKPGYHVLIATQTSPEGPVFGTPARASLLVGSAPAETNAPPSETSAAVVNEGTSTGTVALTVALGVFGLLLFGAGLSLFFRQSRPSPLLAPERDRT